MTFWQFFMFHDLMSCSRIPSLRGQWEGFDRVSRLQFRLEMSRAAEIGSSTSAGLAPLNSATILSFQHIFPYNFDSSLQKYACYILLKTTGNKLLFLITFMCYDVGVTISIFDILCC